LVRKVRQVCDGGERRFGIKRETVRSAISMPSLRSSPWIRGAPQSGFAGGWPSSRNFPWISPARSTTWCRTEFWRRTGEACGRRPW